MLKGPAKDIKLRFEKNNVVCERIIHIFSLLSNKIRFRIVCLLSKGEFFVQEIVDIISCGNLTNISQHLKLLNLSGVISKKRDKKKIIYFIRDHKVKELVEYLEKTYSVL